MLKAVEPLAHLQAFVAKYETQHDAAAALAISDAYLSDLLNGRREFSERILVSLGLTRVVVKA